MPQRVGQSIRRTAGTTARVTRALRVQQTPKTICAGWTSIAATRNPAAISSDGHHPPIEAHQPKHAASHVLRSSLHQDRVRNGEEDARAHPDETRRDEESGGRAQVAHQRKADQEDTQAGEHRDHQKAPPTRAQGRYQNGPDHPAESDHRHHVAEAGLADVQHLHGKQRREDEREGHAEGEVAQRSQKDPSDGLLEPGEPQPFHEVAANGRDAAIAGPRVVGHDHEPGEDCGPRIEEDDGQEGHLQPAERYDPAGNPGPGNPHDVNGAPAQGHGVGHELRRHEARDHRPASRLVERHGEAPHERECRRRATALPSRR